MSKWPRHVVMLCLLAIASEKLENRIVVQGNLMREIQTRYEDHRMNPNLSRDPFMFHKYFHRGSRSGPTEPKFILCGPRLMEMVTSVCRSFAPVEIQGTNQAGFENPVYGQNPKSNLKQGNSPRTVASVQDRKKRLSFNNKDRAEVNQYEKLPTNLVDECCNRPGCSFSQLHKYCPTYFGTNPNKPMTTTTSKPLLLESQNAEKDEPSRLVSAVLGMLLWGMKNRQNNENPEQIGSLGQPPTTNSQVVPRFDQSGSTIDQSGADERITGHRIPATNLQNRQSIQPPNCYCPPSPTDLEAYPRKPYPIPPIEDPWKKGREDSGLFREDPQIPQKSQAPLGFADEDYGLITVTDKPIQTSMGFSRGTKDY